MEFIILSIKYVLLGEKLIIFDRCIAHVPMKHGLS